MTVKPIAMRDAFLDRIWRAMADAPDVVFVTADFGSPVLDRIRADFPERFINVGIAEQNLINVCSGLALEGFRVFAYAIAPFITMRCHEQIRVNLALLSALRPMNVTLIGVGAGFSYALSGPTHQCFEDLTVMRALPNVQVFSPADHMTATAVAEKRLQEGGIAYVRMDAQPMTVLYPDGCVLEGDGYQVHRVGGETCLVATGAMTHVALEVAESVAGDGLDLGVIDLVTLNGHRQDDLARLLSGYARVVTLEEGFAGRGGLDALIRELLPPGLPVLNIGVPPAYRFEIGNRRDLWEQAQIGPRAVAGRVRAFCQDAVA